MQVNEKNVLTHFKRIDETDNSHTKSKNNATTDARIIRIPITIPPEQKPKSSFGITYGNVYPFQCCFCSFVT